MYHVCVKPEEAISSPLTEFTDGFELPMWGLEIKPGSSGSGDRALNHGAIINLIFTDS